MKRINTITVCILTAGIGSRMGVYATHFNKAILPFRKKAIITHIIEKFPKETEFVIGLGYLGDQVRNYLNIAHPDLNFSFFNVDNYDQFGCGPGYSLLCCRKGLQKPFFFISCDTIWEENLEQFVFDYNWMGVSLSLPDKHQEYCNLKIINDNVDEIYDKSCVEGDQFKSFIGLMYIKDYDIFWKYLEQKTTVKGEVQVSSGIHGLLAESVVKSKSYSWIDMGDIDKYKKNVSFYEDYDFSKTNEFFYQVNNSIIKVFSDPLITKTRYEKATYNLNIFPPQLKKIDQFMSYEYVNGHTLYQQNNTKIFQNLMHWLSKNLWIKKAIDKKKFHNCCQEFYQKKTYARLALYEKKYGSDTKTMPINSFETDPIKKLLDIVPWNLLFNGEPYFIHGDLQFDNILIDQSNDNFVLLDWRQDFAGLIEIGDIYYDLAKLYGGIILNYDLIKKNLFNYFESDKEIFFDFATRYSFHNYIAILTKFVKNRSFDIFKVQLIVSLIYINMAPLHHYPFDKMLFSLGKRMLQEVINQL